MTLRGLGAIERTILDRLSNGAADKDELAQELWGDERPDGWERKVKNALHRLSKKDDRVKARHVYYLE